MGSGPRVPAQSLSSKQRALGDPPPAMKGIEQLTARERDVLAQLVAGASNKEAGRALGISPRTIETHRANIMHKLGAKNVADLVRIALAKGQRR